MRGLEGILYSTSKKFDLLLKIEDQSKKNLKNTRIVVDKQNKALAMVPIPGRSNLA
jgi:hypothetical protein